jgi:hypothetical protein
MYDIRNPTTQAHPRAYSSPSLLLVRDRAGKVIEVLKSACGVRQGDPLGLLHFCLALMSPLSAAVEPDENKALTGRVLPVAFADDVNFASRNQHDLVASMKTFDAQLSAINLRIARLKTKLFIHEDVPLCDELKAAVVEFGVTVVHDAAPILGCTVGFKMDAVSAQLLAQIDAQKSLFEMITGPGFSTQASFALLRSSLTAKLGLFRVRGILRVSEVETQGRR